MRLAIVLFVDVAFSIAPAAAQDHSYVPLTSLGSHFSKIDPCSDLDVCMKIAADERAKQGPEPPVPRYRPSEAVSSANRAYTAQAVADSGTISLKEAMANIPDRNAVLKLWKEAIPIGNFSPDDMADVLAKYWIFSWWIGANIDQAKLTEAAMAPVRVQMHALVAADPELASISEDRRQLVSERLMEIENQDAILLVEAADNHKGFAEARKNAQERFQMQFNIPLDSLVLTTNRGFVLKR